MDVAQSVLTRFHRRCIDRVGRQGKATYHQRA
jgi:hypothetical protein